VNVKDDVAVRLLPPEPRERGVRQTGAVQLHPPQAGLELARVGKCQRLGDLDDQTALDELQAVGVGLSVLKAVRAGETTKNLDAGAG